MDFDEQGRRPAHGRRKVRLIDLVVRCDEIHPACGGLLARAGVAVGDAISEVTAKRIRQTALAMDEHFRVEFEREANGELVLTLLAR